MYFAEGDLMLDLTISQSNAVSLQITEAGQGQFFLVAAPKRYDKVHEVVSNAYTQIADAIIKNQMEIVHERIFGTVSVESAVMAARHEVLSKRSLSGHNPVTYIQGRPPCGEGFAGVIIHAVSCAGPNSEVWTIFDDGVACGRGWVRYGNTFLILQDIQGSRNQSQPCCNCESQTRQMIERAERLLKQQGASYQNVIRTWFYLSDILSWYGDFNKARNAIYGELGIMPEPGRERLLLPASTGIRGDNPQGTAATMDLIAVVGSSSSRTVVNQMANPHQKDAFRYGSAFSRGAFIREKDISLIQVSGTAAIDRAGKSMYPGDIHAQINCTFEKIETLIDLEGATLHDICAATVFVKKAEYADIFWEMAAARGLENFPGVCVVADVCRDELLFEIDAEVAFNNKGSSYNSLT